MIDLRQIYYNINFMSSNIYLLLQELGYNLNPVNACSNSLDFA